MTFSSVVTHDDYPEYEFILQSFSYFGSLLKIVSVRRIKKWKEGVNVPFTVTANQKFFLFGPGGHTKTNNMLDYIRSEFYGVKDCYEEDLRKKLTHGMRYGNQNIKA